MRKQRRRVTICSQSEIDEIKLRHRIEYSKAVPDLMFIGIGCGLRRVHFRRYSVNVHEGNGDMLQQRLSRHAVVAVGIIGRDVAFISPENADATPINATAEGAGRQQLVQTTGRGTTGKRYPEPTTRRDRVRGSVDEQFRRSPGKLPGISVHPEVARVWVCAAVLAVFASTDDLPFTSAKLHHANNKRCIFIHSESQLNDEADKSM